MPEDLTDVDEISDGIALGRVVTSGVDAEAALPAMVRAWSYDPQTIKDRLSRGARYQYMDTGPYEYRVNGLTLGGFDVAADTEWMSAEKLLEVLKGDLITTIEPQIWMIEQGKVSLNEVSSAKIEKRTVKCSKS
jgi:hypothetical protein